MTTLRHEVRVIHIETKPGSSVRLIEESLDDGFDMLACVNIGDRWLAYTMARPVTRTGMPAPNSHAGESHE